MVISVQECFFLLVQCYIPNSLPKIVLFCSWYFGFDFVGRGKERHIHHKNVHFYGPKSPKMLMLLILTIQKLSKKSDAHNQQSKKKEKRPFMTMLYNCRFTIPSLHFPPPPTALMHLLPSSLLVAY